LWQGQSINFRIGLEYPGTIRLPPEDWRRLPIMAAVRGTSMLEIVHQALTAWFERNQLPLKLL